MNTIQTHNEGFPNKSPRYTAGPWTVGRNGNNPDTVYAGEISVASIFGVPLHTTLKDAQTYAAKCNGFGRRAAKALANAHLIAAAPDLLNTLEFIHDWLSSFSMPPTSTIQEKQEAMAAIEAALAKAKMPSKAKGGAA